LALDLGPARDALQEMNFQKLYTEVLGWSRPTGIKPLILHVPGETEPYRLVPIAEMSNVWIFEVRPSSSTGKIPGAASRKKLALDLRETYREHMLIFLDGQRTQSLWYLLKREGQRDYPREHPYAKGQPGDLALGKLESMVFDLADLEKRIPGVLEVAKRLKDALDVEQVTKRFYTAFKAARDDFAAEIDGIDDDRDRSWYVSVLLNRLMFIYFLQRKHFLDNGDGLYLQNKMEEVERKYGADHFYDTFLRLLFFEGFALPSEEWSPEAQRLLGKIKYLNGGLFLKHRIEQDWPGIKIPDRAFRKLLTLFRSYTWNLDDTPGGKDDELRPHVLGYIFEKYINQKAFGAYYTRPEITNYLCERTIQEYILRRINQHIEIRMPERAPFESWADLMFNLDARLCRALLDILPRIKILDPACGSGAFLVSALDTLVNTYGFIVGAIKVLHDPYLTKWLRDAESTQASFNYYIRKKVITDNLFGVDLMEEAMEIAKLRLFITLVSSVETVDQLEPLPNIDFNILPGNSLIGLVRVDEERLTKLSLFYASYPETVARKKRGIAVYKSAARYGEDLRSQRNEIDELRKEGNEQLNQLLLNEFSDLRIKYEEATWDNARRAAGKTARRSLHIEDIVDLHPFHWGYEFDEVMENGGFDIIIANPPWEALKPQAKEFFALHERAITKNKMRIEDFEQEQSRLLQNDETRDTWLKYQSAFPHQSAYFRATPQYANQISVVNGKKQGTDINLYKLFVEQCYNLLRDGGLCGLVVPSGIYTDLGAKQLRELLFSSTRVTGLFGFENRKNIFEGVDSRFKFVVLTYRKGGHTDEFPAAFMRHDVSELTHFPQQGSQRLSVELIRQLSPDSLSIMEFRSEIDISIAQKMLKHPLFSMWNLSLSREFDMTNDSSFFRSKPDLYPLYEGKMIHQFNHLFSSPRYWIDAKGKQALIAQEVRRTERLIDDFATSQGFLSMAKTVHERAEAYLASLGLGSVTQSNVHIDAELPRLAFRDIARNTDERTLIATVLPANIFAGNTLNYVIPWRFEPHNLMDGQKVEACYWPSFLSTILVYLCGVLNSFALDYFVRFKVTAHVNMFYFYQLPAPLFSDSDAFSVAIVHRAARLICTTSEFADLWQEIFPAQQWTPEVAATEEAERARLRAEIDGLVAHLYELSEEEFRYILGTFPLVEQKIKDDALQAYRDFSLSQSELELLEEISRGESQTLEFKIAACWNARKGQKNEAIVKNILEEVAAFLTSREGGKVLIGVEDSGTIVGLEDDYRAANPQKQSRDGYELYLLEHLKKYLQGNWSLCYKISFVTLRGKEICCIEVQPASSPVYNTLGEFHIREGSRKRKLSPQETMDYIQQRWP
jgi:hypothetical protein